MDINREQLGLSQQNIADVAGVDVSLVEQYEKGELLTEPHDYDKLVAHDKIHQALVQIIAERYPEKVLAALARQNRG